MFAKSKTNMTAFRRWKQFFVSVSRNWRHVSALLRPKQIKDLLENRSISEVFEVLL